MPLQKQFRGFADYVGFYQGGNVPIELADALIPVVSAEDFLGELKETPQTGTLTAIDQTALCAPTPEGKLWRVRSIHFNGSDATANIRMYPVYLDDGSRPFGFYPYINNTTFTAGSPIMEGWLFDGHQGFWLKGDQRLGFNLKNASGAIAGIPFTTLIRYQEIEI